VARRAHWGFERRQKETARRAKQEAKRQRRAAGEVEAGAGPEMGEAPAPVAEPGVWEWFSPSRTRVVTSAPGSRPPADEPDDWILLTETGPADPDMPGPASAPEPPGRGAEP
jgi:hypothetical protein